MNALLEEARLNSDIFVVVTDSRGSSALDDFAKALPSQFVEAGIAEQDAVGIGAGLARSGKKVFVCGPACFHSSRSVEQVRVDAAYADLDLKIVGVSGGVAYGALGATHHSLHDVALYRSIPNMIVILPADSRQAELAARSLAHSRGPVYLRMGRNPVPEVYGAEAAAFRVGKANLLRDGRDCAIVSCGEALRYAAAAAELLAARGIGCRLLDMPTIKPLDETALLSAAEDCGAMVTVEEAYAKGGLGGAVAELLAERRPTPMRILGFPDEYLPSGSQGELFAHVGLDAEGVAKSVEAFVSGLRKDKVAP
jgi:transketolase